MACVASAVAALRRGTHDYLTASFDLPSPQNMRRRLLVCCWRTSFSSMAAQKASRQTRGRMRFSTLTLSVSLAIAAGGCSSGVTAAGAAAGAASGGGGGGGGGPERSGAAGDGGSAPIGGGANGGVV